MYKIIGADGKEYGPITAEALRQWIAEGRADGRTRVLGPGMTVWKTLAELPEFADLLPGAQPAAQPAPLPVTPEPAKTNGFAVTGMIMGILSLTCCSCVHGLPFNVLGLLFSALGLSQINQDPERQKGRGMAIAGLVLSLFGIGMALLLWALGVSIHAHRLLHHLRGFPR